MKKASLTPLIHLRTEELAALADERICSEIRMPPFAIFAAHPHGSGKGPALGERQHQGSAFVCDGIPRLIFEREEIAPFGGGHFPGFIEALTQNQFGGFIVINERALGFNEDDGHGETACQLPGQNNLYRFGR